MIILIDLSTVLHSLHQLALNYKATAINVMRKLFSAV